MSTTIDPIDAIIYECGYECAKIMDKHKDRLSQVQWTDGESNLDTEFSNFACLSCYQAWQAIVSKYPHYAELTFACHPPDVNIRLTYPNGNVIKKKIELKSSLKNIMPGSTIKQLNINQPLIYCIRPCTKKADSQAKPQNNLYRIRFAQYHATINTSKTDLFQDRTPRQKLNFEKMQNVTDAMRPYVHVDKNSWIDHYVECALNRIKINNSVCHSWQDDLVKNLKTNIINEYILNTSVEDFQMSKVVLELSDIQLFD